MFKVDNAVILAAGVGSRFIPITFETPKGLVPVRGVPMIERQIRQLRAAGIQDIIIVTGYMREKFNYLKEKYGKIKIIYNREYAVKNNLSSLFRVRRFLKNTYILSSDNWIRENMFHPSEERSWYSAVYKEGPTDEWCLSLADDGRITDVTIGGADSWVMYGPVFLSEDFSVPFREKLYQYYHTHGTENYMWEHIFIAEKAHFDLYVNKQKSDNVYEFESLEELRAFDPEYGYRTSNKCLAVISNVFGAEESAIKNVAAIKAGMTNNSFSFEVNGEAYIFRHPGKGSNLLIDRRREKAVYETIKPLGVSDDVVYFDEKSGVKISRYYKGARNTSAQNLRDLKDSLALLRRVHLSGLKTAKPFLIDREIKRYMNMMIGKDNLKYLFSTRMYLKMIRVLVILKKMKVPKTLCHVDCNPDNFIRLEDGTLKLIDWEYAGMADPIMDIAMYAIYAYYSKKEADDFLKLYLGRNPRLGETLRLYAYMALGGFLWMLWTEYKEFFGVAFGDYGRKMRQYAEVYYDYTLSLAGKNKKSKKPKGR
ncbi:MAG: NTP transferase domain-containing protein [Treponema sp.]|jgi:CTP:phosphocholine cytidylyltransferase-like protein/thiamine kinase-like enzyme|nr:NTP transferase domain-containing protein [Treponema sp.]